MNILVIATASRSSGALAIYKQFLFHLKRNVGDDNYLILMHETMPHPDIKGVGYYAVDTTTTFRRLYFDYFSCSQLLKKIGFSPDLLFSLQNTGVFSLKNLPQCIYYHQSLPFYDRKWNFFKREERSLLLCKIFYPFFVKNTIGKQTYFVAQIPYIKEGIVKHFKVAEDKVQVYMPDVESLNPSDIPFYDYGDCKKHFVYPAIPAKYKEHETLLRGLALIRDNNDIVLHFTFSKNDYPELEDLIYRLKLANNIVFEGRIEHQKLLSMLKSSRGLLFPSTIETLGLPLLEAAFLGLPIIAADVVYANQVLENYKGVSFVNPYNYDEWAKKMELLSKKELRYTPISVSKDSSWDVFFNWIHTIYRRIE